MKIESFKVSERGKQQLIQLKRKTGIENWNTLCRWAFCLSLSETSVPPEEELPSDSNVEMTWKTFTGNNEEIYLAILRQRLIDDSLCSEDVMKWFRIHLHRGISYLNNNVKKTVDLLSLIA